MLIGIAATFLLLMIAVFSSCQRIEPGYVGVKVSYSGEGRGIEIVPSGREWYNPFTQTIYEFPTFAQTAKWTRSAEEGSATNQEISFNSREGLIITADVSLSFQLDPSKIAEFYAKFRKGDLSWFIDNYLRNVSRDHFNAVAATYSVEDIYGSKKEEFLEGVRKRINDQVKDIGVRLEQFGFIGAPRLPQQVAEALTLKITATQQAMKAENELRIAEAEAKKRIAAAEGDAKAQIARAQGEAEANLKLASSITQQLIEWKRLEIMTKWNGVLPTVQGGGNGMILQLPMPTH